MSAERSKIALEVSKPEKLMYPDGFTKGQVVDYYARAARWLLPHLKNRLVTLKRYPDGAAGECFYEKDAPSFTPEWIATFPVPRVGGGPPINYILLNDAATLFWAANTCNLEIHPFLCAVPEVDAPTSVVFDLDPGEGRDALAAAEAAFLVKKMLDRLKLESFVKVSGSKGVHVHVPLNSGANYASTQPFARSIAEALERDYPDRIVADMAKDRRKGKVFIDWSQNVRHKTTVAPYSLRAVASHPTVAMPLAWGELKRALKKGDSAFFRFEPEAALKRFAKTGDLFAPLLKLKQNLPRPFLALGETAQARVPLRLAGAKGERQRFPSSNESAANNSAPRLPKLKTQGGRRLYVVQKHAGRRLHYDLRLQIGDTVKSWAVPDGAPLAAGDARAARATEDRSLEYARFEGVISAGEEGAGAVMVWDIGGYEVVEGDYWKGELHIFLSGTKLKGEWLLRRTPGGKRNAWEWIKLGASARLPRDNANASALSGRTLEEIATAHEVTRSPQPKKIAATAVEAIKLEALPGGRFRFIEPMYAEPAAALPSAGRWLYEIKLDGYRCLALKRDGSVTLFSRRGNKLNADFPEIAKQLLALEDGAMLDGEIVALDALGRPSFNLLQNHLTRKESVRYYVFDLLHYKGRSLLGVPLERRRAALKAMLPKLPQVGLSQDFPDGARLLESVKKMGLEGVIAKRADSVYEPGKRSGAWRKLKLQAGQECVVGGYKVGRPLESLLVGVYENGRLVFLDKVRYGLTPWLRAELHRRLSPLEQAACPFANLPERPTRKGAVTREEMENIRWLKPEAVAQIAFNEWTPDGHLRHPTFVGLREDKDAREVVRERVR
jgi:bifunctional non-homologous end joining protein LigD